ncbi:ATP-binding cassette domain-containing protein, partial [Streptomyces sp. TRM64462]|uniref:ATP-binding cassette domain-containing protein n=1 Tax=Streptomyces sp. TRM64462 TaxID=2741726 RepID=UPI001585D8D7
GAFDPVRALLWFAAVLVLGADSLLAPLAAAALLVGLDAGARGGAAAAVIGLLAALTARVPPLTALLTRRRPQAQGPAPSPAHPETHPGANPEAHPEGRPGARLEAAAAAAHPVGAEPGRTAGPAGPGPRPAGATPGRAPTRAGGARPARLRAHGVAVRFGGFTALDGVDFAVPGGQVTALVGPNGAGKSTLFHCLAGTVRPASGRVTLDGVDITRRPAHARNGLGIARTFQELAVFPSLTVAENVRVGAEQGHVRDDPDDATEQALRLLGLDGSVRARPAAGLSTGVLRRVELARALAGQPHTLLIDEPAAGLDAAETAALAHVLTALAADGMAVLVVEHDPDLVAGIAHTVHVMEAGRIVA